MSETPTDFRKCARADHPDEPHYHYGYAGAHWSRTFPHWDIDARPVRYDKAPARLDVHPDMDVAKGWRS